MADDVLATVLTSPMATVAVGQVEGFAEWLAQQRALEKEIHWLPQFITIAEDAASIKIEQVRDLKAELALSLHAKEGRDVVFLQADKIFPVAQQALLKILEEPPKRVKFWLVTEQPTALLDTILSRSLIFELPTVGQRSLEKEAIDLSVFVDHDLARPLSLIQSFSNTGDGRAKAVGWVTELLTQLRASRETSVAQQQACLEALEWLGANAHVGLTLDNLVITLWKSAQKPPR